MNKLPMKWALFQTTEIARKLRNKKLSNLLAEFYFCSKLKTYIMKKALLIIMIAFFSFEGNIGMANTTENTEEIPMSIYDPVNSGIKRKAPMASFAKPTVTYDFCSMLLSVKTTDNVIYMEAIIYDEAGNILYQQAAYGLTDMATFALPIDVDERKDHITLTIDGRRFFGYF